MSAMTISPLTIPRGRHGARRTPSCHLVGLPGHGRRRPASVSLGRSGSPTLAALTPLATSEPVGLRLTRRGRLVITVTVAVLVSVVAVMGATDALAAPTAQPTVTRSVLVLPGQSLWSIATSTSPDEDPRDTIIDIRELNNLPDSQVFAGQTLVVPVG